MLSPTRRISSFLRTAAVAALSFLAAAALWTGARAAGAPWPAARPGDAGPRDTKALVRNHGVAVGFTPRAGVTYQVYRHDKASGRRFLPLGRPAAYFGEGEFASQERYQEGQPGSRGWYYDYNYDYLFYVDPGVAPYEEYYYLVAADTDRDPAGSAIADPNAYLSAYMVAAAFPPTQTRHGNFSEYTDACTACHGLHSAQHPKLLKGPTTTDLCGTCHDGSGSKYDIVMGRVRTGPDWSTFTKNPAGPFGDQLRPVAGAPVLTSRHNVFRAGLTADGGVAATAAQLWQAPGSTYLAAGSAPGGSAWTSALLCTSCHEPHNRFNNFRLLRGDYSVGEYALPALGEARTGIVVRGVSEVFPDQVPPALDQSWQTKPYTHGQAASRYLAGSGITGSAVADFCSACHRIFTMPETIPAAVYGVIGEHRHKVGMPASDAYLLGRIIDGPLGPWGDVCFAGDCAGQGRLEDFTGGNLYKYVPLEGMAEDDPATGRNEYASNKVVCLTCHVAHGTGAAAGGMLPDPANPGQMVRANLEVAYRNNVLNGTDALPALYEEDQATGVQRGPNPVAGYLFNRRQGLIYGSSSVLARFEPFASACYRCHSTTPR